MRGCMKTHKETSTVNKSRYEASGKEKLRPLLEPVIAALENYPIPFPSLSDPTFLAAQAFNKFLNGEVDSLDKAFGLKASRGAMPTTEKYKQAVVGAALRLENEGFFYTSIDKVNIPELLEEEGFDKIDERTIREWRDELPVVEFGNKGTRHVLYLIGKRLEDPDLNKSGVNSTNNTQE